MKIAIASDHAGFILKGKIIDHLTKKGVEVIDFGPVNTESVDYPVYAKKVTSAITTKEADFGILVCGSGIGMSIAANKVKGIRCALLYSLETARLSREHNHANVMAIGERLTDHDLALQIVDVFISTKEEARHQKRVDMLNEMGDEEDVFSCSGD